MDSLSQSDFLEKIEKEKEKYYELHSKNKYFNKQSQKKDCALEIGKSIPIEIALPKFFFQIPNTHHIYFDFNISKIYFYDEYFESAVNYANPLFENMYSQYNNVIGHINIETLTVTSLTKIIPILYRYLQYGIDKTDNVSLIYVYNTPNFMEQIKLIMKLFFQKFKNRIIMYNKKESQEKLKELFSPLSTNEK
jgi:type II secretory pathway component GspD/PulD (secretin)